MQPDAVRTNEIRPESVALRTHCGHEAVCLFFNKTFQLKRLNCGCVVAIELDDALNTSKTLERGIPECMRAQLCITAHAIACAHVATSVPICEAARRIPNDLSHF